MNRPVVRLAVQTLVVASLVAVALLVVGPVRTEMNRRFDEIRDQVIESLEDYLGRPVTYGSISPSILRYITVNDLTIHGSPTEPGEILQVRRLRIYYRPLRLLQGRFTEAFFEVRIENSTLDIDMRLDADLVSRLAQLIPSGPDDVGVLPADLVVSGRNLTVAVRGDFGRVEMERVFFDTTLVDQVVSIQSQGRVGLGELPDTFPVSELSGQIEADGTINLITGDTLLDIAFPEVETDIATIKRQVVQVRYAHGELEARNVQNRDPVDLYVRYSAEQDQVYARILADGYRVSELITLKDQYAEYNPYLDLPLRGQASATISADGITYTGSIRTALHMMPVPDGELTVQFDGNENRLDIDELRYRSAIGGLEFAGHILLDPFRPTGRLVLEDALYGDLPPITVSGDIVSDGDTIQLATDPFSFAGVGFQSIAGTVELGRTPRTEFTVELASALRSVIALETIHRSSGALVRVAVDAHRVDPDEILRLQEVLLPDAEMPDLSFLPDSLLVDMQAEVNLRHGVVVDIPALYAVDTGDRRDQISLGIRYDNGSVTLRNVDVRYAGYNGHGDVTAEIRRDGTVTFGCDVVVEGIPYQFTGVLDANRSLHVSGLYDVEARLFFGEGGQLVFDASGDIPVPIWDDQEARVDFAANGYYFSPNRWAVTVSRLEADGIAFGTIDHSTVQLAGTVSPTGAQLSRVGFDDGISEVTGSGDVSWGIPELAAEVNLQLASNDTGEEYLLHVAYQDETVQASATIDRLPLTRLKIDIITGSVSGTVDVAGPLDNLTLGVDAALVDGRFKTDPVELEASLQLNRDGFNVEYARGRWVRTRAENIQASLSVEDGRLDVSGDLVQGGETGAFDVGVTGSATFADISQIADVVTSDFTGGVEISGLPVQDDTPDTWRFDMVRNNRVVTGAGGPDSAITFEIQPNWDFTAAVTDPLPLRFDAVGRVDRGDLELDMINVEAEVARLWRIVDSPDFTFTGGMATGSMRVFGPINDPDFYGMLIASNLTASLDMIPDTIGPVRTYLVFDEKVLTARETTVSIGSGAARTSAAITLDRWLPEEWAVWIQTVTGSPVRTVNDFGGVAVDGHAEGSLQIVGDTTTTTITGELTASSMDIVLSSNEPDTGPEEDPGDLRVDVTVRSGRGIEFLWPSTAFPILRAIADVGQRVTVSYRSQSGAYHVAGPVEIQGGEVFYFDRSFYVREGRMVFDEDETGFDPLLTVQAEIREISDEGPVRIYLVADEAPLSEFTPHWESDPPLTETAIIALLGGTVFVTQEGTPIDLSQAVLLTSDLVSQFGIIRGVETTVRDALGLDLFSIRTQLFQNLLRGMMDDSYPLDTGVNSLGKYLDNTTVFLGKYLGTDLFLELLVQLQASDPELGASRSIAGVDVDSEFSLEWQTPFFQLEWGFFPRNPSTLFLTDNTFRFLWEYSY